MRSERTRSRDQGSTPLPDFHIRVLSSDGRWIVQVSGEVDAHTATRLRDSLDELISGGARHIVVDLADVSFMGASGLGVLVRAGKRLQREEGELLLRSSPPGVNKLIEITALENALRHR